jgi:hypothetical protein
MCQNKSNKEKRNLLQNKVRKKFWKCLLFCSGSATILTGNSQGKRRCGRPGYRWQGNIKMDLKEIGYVGGGGRE